MLPLGMSRREMLTRCGVGMGLVGLTQLLGDAGLLTQHAKGAVNPLAPKKPHFPAKAKHVIHLFANGGPSQVDTFDPKPALDEVRRQVAADRRTSGPSARPAPPSRRRSSSRSTASRGLEVSELFAHTAKHIDDICVIRSMYADVPNHEPSFLLMNTGEPRLIRPSVGSWVTYGLGTENQNLPGFVAMCPGGYPLQESQNWQSGFLPGVFQGTYIDSKNTDVEKLVEFVKNKTAPGADQRKQLDLLAKLNQMHQAERPNDPQLEARIQSFELAYRMQSEARGRLRPLEGAEERSSTPTAPASRPGACCSPAGWSSAASASCRCSHGPVQPWDSHDDLEIQHRRLAGQVDRAIAALIADLKRLGLFEATLILWGGEFGRTPVVEMPTPGATPARSTAATTTTGASPSGWRAAE